MAESPLMALYRGRNGAETGIGGLDGGFRARLEAMFAAMPAEIRAGFSISSGFRTVEHQQQLWDDAVRKYGSEAAARKWVAPPGRSNHGPKNGAQGLAADLTFGTDNVRRWVHSNAHRFGMHFPMKHEPWHIEPIGVRDGTYVPTGSSIPVGGDPDAYTYLDEESAVLDTSLEAQLLRLGDMIQGDSYGARSVPVSAAGAARTTLANRDLTGSAPMEEFSGVS